jgi:hypothetical protein
MASTLETMLAGPGWVELAHSDNRYVCPHCNVGLAKRE